MPCVLETEFSILQINIHVYIMHGQKYLWIFGTGDPVYWRTVRRVLRWCAGTKLLEELMTYLRVNSSKSYPMILYSFI